MGRCLPQLAAVLRFDPDDVSLLAWEQVEAVDQEPTGPDGDL